MTTRQQLTTLYKLSKIKESWIKLPPPKSWLAESILVTIFCCLPFGIVGIVYASKINSLFAAGQYEAAEQASANAGKWTKIGFFVGIAYWVLMAIIYGGTIMAMV